MSDEETKRKDLAKQAAFQKAFGFSLVGISNKQEAQMIRMANESCHALDSLLNQAEYEDSDDYPESAGVIEEARSFRDGCNPNMNNYAIATATVLGCRARIKTLEALKASKAFAQSAKDKSTRANRMQEIGDRVKTPQDAGFVIAALKTKFNVDAVAGHLGKKALPRLYKLLDSLPPGHTQFNDSLKQIVRGADGAFSFFSDTDKLIRINIGSMKETKEYQTAAGKVEVNKFDSTMLHEVGHSVDDAVGLMATRMSQATYGGWRELSFDDVITEGVAAFKSSWKEPMPADNQIRDILVAATRLQALPEVIVKEETVLPEALEEDTTVKWANSLAQYAGQARNLSQTDAGELALGDHVYIKNGYKSGAWFSYLLSARSTQVSNYQFYAPPEWFAEVYALRMLDKLPKSHPCYDLIGKLDGRTKVSS